MHMLSELRNNAVLQNILFCHRGSYHLTIAMRMPTLHSFNSAPCVFVKGVIINIFFIKFINTKA